jgi:hypothetical protein
MIYFFTGSDDKGQALDEGDRRLGDGDGHIGDGHHIGGTGDLDTGAKLHPSQRPSSRRRAGVRRRAMFVGVSDYRDVRG